MKIPASWHRDMYREAAPAGNGVIGAMVYGGIAHETIAVNHSNLWGTGKVQMLPDIHETLQKTREGIDRGDYMNSNQISANALKALNYTPKLGTPCPLCDIHIERKERKIFKHYQRSIHMDSGEVTVQWEEESASFSRKLFVSRTRDLLFCEIASVHADMDLEIWLDMHETYEDDAKRKRESLKGNSCSYSCGNNIVYYAKHDNDTYYGAAGIIRGNGAVTASKGGKVHIRNTAKVLLILQPFVQKTYEYVMGVKNGIFLEKLFPEETFDYEAMKLEHKKLHKALYLSTELHLAQEEDRSNEELLLEAYDGVSPSVLLEKQWKYGRYLMICGTREDGLPFPLYGLWHGRYKMAWPHYMGNENIEMTYWHIMAGGLSFAMKAFIRYYVTRMDCFREAARKIFGLPGIYLPAGTTPGNCYPSQIVPVILNWIGCAGWISHHFYQYYLYTGDEETLKKEILPFMEAAAEFYENYLVKEKKGTYKIYPSVSPENTPGNLVPKGNEDLAHPCPSVINAVMDVAIIKELMRNLLKLSKKYDRNRDKQQRWEEIQKNLPAYETTEDGTIKEWIAPGLAQRYNHRHLSHLYPVFPGNEIVKDRDDDTLLASFEKAVDKREPGAQTGWSLAHMACIYARIKRPEKALECLDILNKTCLLNNFFTLHNDWRGMGLTLEKGSFAPVQLDAVMGIAAAIQEMLLYAGEDFLKLLPALPGRFFRGSVKALRFCTGTVSMEWDTAKPAFHALLQAERETKVQLFLPEAFSKLHAYDRRAKGIVKNKEWIFIKAGETLELSTDR